MRIEIYTRITQGRDGVYRFPFVIGNGQHLKTHYFDLKADYQPDSSEPTRPLGQELSPVDGFWAYRGTVVNVKGGNELSIEEVQLRIKHAVLRHDRAFERMRREIEAFENIERADMDRRARIPDSVRLFVWQRDQGKCVNAEVRRSLSSTT